MDDPSVQIDAHHAHDISEISILIPAPVLDCESNDSAAAGGATVDDIPKSIRNKFYSNINSYEKNWSATCLLCNKIQYDKIGVTSNNNRHVKTQHKKEYEQWLVQLRHCNNKNQTKISNIFSKNDDTTKTVSSSKSCYHTTYPRQIALSQAIVLNLIIDLGLPLPLVERQPFLNFMHLIDPKFTITSRRTLGRSTIPRLYNNMNDELKRFCDQAEFISITLDIWTDRRMRAFYAMTGHAFINSSLKSFVLCFFPLYGSHTANLLLQNFENVINGFDIQTKLVRLVTHNASNNIKAFQDLIIPGFENYFENEDDDEISSDIDPDAIEEEDDETPDPFCDDNYGKMIDVIKTSFDHIAASNESLRTYTVFCSHIAVGSN